MNLTVSDDIIKSTRMSARELMQEIAIMLYQKGKITLGQGSRLADTSQFQFQHLLAGRQIDIHYDQSDFEQDLKTLNELGKDDCGK
jgi:predicted HTH domain antitoxin